MAATIARAGQAEYLALQDELLFSTPRPRFSAAAAEVRRRLSAEWETASAERRSSLVELAAELAIDLGSYLVRWHLCAPEAPDALDEAVPRGESARLAELVASWGATDRSAAIRDEVAAIDASNLRRISTLADAGTVRNRIGHDAAVGLGWNLRRGGVMATTNPVMVNAVRSADPDAWDPERDALRASHPDASAEERASLMTMRVVLDGCREMRPIWTATDGRFGHLSLQISPRSNEDAGRMTEEAVELHGRLEAELGGPPNTRFKIPGTKAGLEAVRQLTARGIGVTVTVAASVDQHVAFAEAIEEGSAPLSFLTLMMGRLDDPVGEELEAAGVAGASELSRWASTAVLRRSYRLVHLERGYERSALLAASMRGPWNIDGAIADGPADVYITCFPDRALEYDGEEREITPRIAEEMPEGIVERLGASRTFREAYEVDGLTVDGFADFVPVVRTLAQFNANYDAFVEYNA